MLEANKITSNKVESKENSEHGSFIVIEEDENTLIPQEQLLRRDVFSQSNKDWLVQQRINIAEREKKKALEDQKKAEADKNSKKTPNEIVLDKLNDMKAEFKGERDLKNDQLNDHSNNLYDSNDVFLLKGKIDELNKKIEVLDDAKKNFKS